MCTYSILHVHWPVLKLRTVPPNAEVFLHSVIDYTENADLSVGYWNPERKLGVEGLFVRDN